MYIHSKLCFIMKKLMYDGLHWFDRIITNLETKPPKNLENQKKKIIHLI